MMMVHMLTKNAKEMVTLDDEHGWLSSDKLNSSPVVDLGQ